MGQEFRRILVIATRQIGDVLLTTPLIHAARKRWPEAEIDILGFAGTLGMLDGNPDVTRRIEVRPGADWRASMALIRKLWRHYDLALVAQHSDRAYMYGWIAAGTRVGLLPQRSSHAWWKRKLLTHGVTIAGDRGATHTVVEKLSLLEPWFETLPTPHIVPPAGAQLPVALADQLAERYLVVHAPSMWRYKQWPAPYYRELVKALLEDGWQVVLTGGPGEADRALVADLATLMPSPRLIDAAGSLSLNQMVELLRNAVLYVGPDTSITHLAAACGVPTIALFGPSNPLRWAPWPQDASSLQPYARRMPLQRAGKVILMQGEAPCAPGVPCGRAGCQDHNASPSACLEEGLSPERVIAQARSALARAQA